MKNQQPPELRQHVQRDDVEAAVPLALSAGRMLFNDIERDQVDPCCIAVLRRLAADGEQVIVPRETLMTCCPTALDVADALSLLQRRELVEAIGDGYRVQVELIRRWFA